MRDRLIQWRCLFATVLVVVLALSLLPSSVSQPTTGWDKSNHFFAFSVLGWLGARSWPCRTVSTAFGLLAYGVLIEVLQSFTPDRFADRADVLADGIGIVFGIAVALLVTRLSTRKWRQT